MHLHRLGSWWWLLKLTVSWEESNVTMPQIEDILSQMRRNLKDIRFLIQRLENTDGTQE
jgi:hypothetical protein